MRKGLKLASVIGMGLFLFSALISPIQAATPEDLEAYKEAVEEVMTEDGQVDLEDRSWLNEQRSEFGLTEQQAKQIEEQVRQALKREAK